MIITSTSHLDPRLSIAHLSLILKLFEGRDAAFIETVDLDEHNAPPVICDLYGPVMDDPPIADENVKMLNDRRTISIGQRLSLGLPVLRRSNLLTVVAGKNGVLLETYGGPFVPPVVVPPGVKIAPGVHVHYMSDDLFVAMSFWKKHALGVGLEVSGI